MPKKKKTAKDMTSEEIAQKVFPKKVRDKLKGIAHEKDSKSDSK